MDKMKRGWQTAPFCSMEFLLCHLMTEQTMCGKISVNSRKHLANDKEIIEGGVV